MPKKWDLRNSIFWGLSRPIAAYIMSWHTKTGYQGVSRYYIKRFCAPTVHPIATTRSFKGATSWALVYIEINKKNSHLTFKRFFLKVKQQTPIKTFYERNYNWIFSSLWRVISNIHININPKNRLTTKLETNKQYMMLREV